MNHFARNHLNYVDVNYNQAKNFYFPDKIETAQYNPAFAITGVTGETSKEKLYQELGFEYLKDRNWLRPMS